MDSMYEILTKLPLLSGASRQRIMEIAGNTRLHFIKYTDGQTLIQPGEQCSHIKFVISGAVRMSTSNNRNTFTVAQTLTAPEVIAPQFLFGTYTSYPCHVTAVGTAGILQISKVDYMKILTMDQVFMFNFLNILSMNAQKSVHGILALTDGSLEQRLAFWVLSLTSRSGTDIEIIARGRDLYTLLGVQRSTFMRTLQSMEQAGLLRYEGNRIRFHSRQTLAGLLDQ